MNSLKKQAKLQLRSKLQLKGSVIANKQQQPWCWCFTIFFWHSRQNGPYKLFLGGNSTMRAPDSLNWPWSVRLPIVAWWCRCLWGARRHLLGDTSLDSQILVWLSRESCYLQSVDGVRRRGWEKAPKQADLIAPHQPFRSPIGDDTTTTTSLSVPTCTNRLTLVWWH